MTIYEIKRRTAETSPYYFSRNSLKFFDQTLRHFSVTKQIDGRYKIAAPMFDKFSKKVIGQSVRFFNPINNELERA